MDNVSRSKQPARADSCQDRGVHANDDHLNDTGQYLRLWVPQIPPPRPG